MNYGWRASLTRPWRVEVVLLREEGPAGQEAVAMADAAVGAVGAGRDVTPVVGAELEVWQKRSSLGV